MRYDWDGGKGAGLIIRVHSYSNNVKRHNNNNRSIIGIGINQIIKFKTIRRPQVHFL